MCILSGEFSGSGGLEAEDGPGCGLLASACWSTVLDDEVDEDLGCPDALAFAVFLPLVFLPLVFLPLVFLPAGGFLLSGVLLGLGLGLTHSLFAQRFLQLFPWALFRQFRHVPQFFIPLVLWVKHPKQTLQSLALARGAILGTDEVNRRCRGDPR